jgi:chromate transport protein ChrA
MFWFLRDLGHSEFKFWRYPIKLAQTAIIASFVYKFLKNVMKRVKSPEIVASP